MLPRSLAFGLVVQEAYVWNSLGKIMIFMVIFFYFLGKSIPCVDGSFHIFCFFFGTYLHVVEAGCNWTFYANVSGLQQTLQKGVF
jgi:hypothetical protein